MRWKNTVYCAGVIWGLSFSPLTSVQAAEGVSKYFGADLDAGTREELSAMIKEISSDPDKQARYREEVRHRTVLCKTCHGEDGKAVKPLTPNLAGQNVDYMIDQMRRFKSKDRFDYWMSNLAIGFTQEDMVKISFYYSSMDGVASGGGSPELQARGKTTYQNVCQECHGESGKGNEGYARLAGQQADYVVKMLKEFRDRTGRRTNPWMTAVSLRLSDDDMQAVAAYIANMK